MDYAYYTNLSLSHKSLHRRCHTLHNNLYHIVFQILKKKFENVYSIFYIWKFIIKKLSVRELDMVKDNVLPVALDLDIDFKANQGLIYHTKSILLFVLKLS